jgi:hypothetical protein
MGIDMARARPGAKGSSETDPKNLLVMRHEQDAGVVLGNLDHGDATDTVRRRATFAIWAAECA